jgi:hypothetical protein
MLPLTVEDTALRVDSEQSIGHGDRVGLGVLGVAEEGVGRPDLVHEVVVERDVLEGAPGRVVVAQARVVPLLAEVAVHRVVHVDLAHRAYRVYLHVHAHLHRSVTFLSQGINT